jgi:hypothetical protein
MAGRCLYCLCDGSYKAVPTVETVFDAILEAHSKGWHAKGTYIILLFGFVVFCCFANKTPVFGFVIFCFFAN